MALPHLARRHVPAARKRASEVGTVNSKNVNWIHAIVALGSMATSKSRNINAWPQAVSTRPRDNTWRKLRRPRLQKQAWAARKDAAGFSRC